MHYNQEVMFALVPKTCTLNLRYTMFEHNFDIIRVIEFLAKSFLKGKYSCPKRLIIAFPALNCAA